MKMIYNKEKIEYIEVLPETLYNEVIFLEEKKGFLGLGYRAKGNYWRYNLSPVIPKQLPKYCITREDGLVYEKCKILIHYPNTKEIIHFNSERERNTYLKREFQEKNWRFS